MLNETKLTLDLEEGSLFSYDYPAASVQIVFLKGEASGIPLKMNPIEDAFGDISHQTRIVSSTSDILS